MRYCKSSAWWEHQSNTGLPQQQQQQKKKKKERKRKISNRQFNLPSKSIKKEEQIEPKVSRRKGILKIREEMKGDERNRRK